MADYDIAVDICRELDEAVADRGTFESHWEEIAQRVAPDYKGSFSAPDSQTPGEKRNQAVYDSTAPIGLGRFTAVMESLLTPRNQTWHKLTPSLPELKKDRNTKLWLDEVNQRLFRYRYAPKANFSGQNHQTYYGLGAFGTGALFIDELADEPGLRYRSVHLGELFLFENHQGLVDKAIRRFRLTARQAVQQFGEAALPGKIVSDAKSTANQNVKYVFLHCVKPREDYDPQRRDSKGMKFASYYVAKEDKHLIRESGFNSFPYAIGRYKQIGGEVYGRSPAMDVLPSIKTINEQKKTVLKAGHRAVDPVLLANDDGVIDTVSLRPGAINWGGVNSDGKELVKSLQVGRVDIGVDLMELESRAINDAFLVTLFQILTETPEMTATEVLERVREKGILLAPAMDRQQSEYLGPLIDRELDVLSRQGLLPPMPRALLEAGGRYEVQYDSPMSRIARAEEASGAMRAIEFALKIAVEAQNPSALDHFDFDIITPEVAEISGMPTRWLNSMDKIKVIRQGRAEAAQQQQMIDAAPGAAGLIKATQGA